MRIRRPGYLSGLTDTLVLRLTILMSLALLPLGAIAISTTTEAIRAAQRAAERSLVSLASEATVGERALIESALASASAIESLVLERLADPEECSAFLADFIARSAVFSFAGFVDLDGEMKCRSSGEEVGFAASPVFRQLREAPMATISANPSGAATGLPVVIVTRPVFQERDLVGFVSISITRRSLELMARRSLADAPQFATLINHVGNVLTLDPESPKMAHLPANTSLAGLSGGGNAVFRDQSADGKAAVYSVAEVIPGRLYALGMWPESSPGLPPTRPAMLPLLFPPLMWLASLGVVLLSLYHLVLRHLKGLNRQMRRFALGHREAWADLPGNPPAELRELNTTFRNMARIIARDEAELENALSEKTVLLKEVHHRVKNNLQLISSIINLQARQFDDPKAQRVLRNVQERVQGLATIHRSLYEEARLSEVRADRVIEDILGRIVSLGGIPGRLPELIKRLEPVVLSTDQIVPLSFLVTEAVTNAVKHLSSGREGDAGWIEVVLRPEESGEILLRITNLAAGAPEAPEGEGEADEPASGPGDGIGVELIEAFAMQLDGRIDIGRLPREDGRGPAWRLELRFRAER